MSTRAIRCKERKVYRGGVHVPKDPHQVEKHFSGLIQQGLHPGIKWAADQIVFRSPKVMPPSLLTNHPTFNIHLHKSPNKILFTL